MNYIKSLDILQFSLLYYNHMSLLSPDLVDMWLFSYYIYPNPFSLKLRTFASCVNTCLYYWLIPTWCLYLSLMAHIYCLMFMPHGPYLNMRMPWGYFLLQYKYPIIVLYKSSCKYCINFYAIFQVDLSHCANFSALSY